MRCLLLLLPLPPAPSSPAGDGVWQAHMRCVMREPKRLGGYERAAYGSQENMGKAEEGTRELTKVFFCAWNSDVHKKKGGVRR